MKKLVLAALAVTFFAVPAGASLADPSTRRVSVSTSDLDLTRARDQRVLDLRILHAASSLCETPFAAHPLGWKAFKRCRDAAMAGTKAQRQSVVASAMLKTVDILASAK